MWKTVFDVAYAVTLALIPVVMVGVLWGFPTGGDGHRVRLSYDWLPAAYAANFAAFLLATLRWKRHRRGT